MAGHELWVHKTSKFFQNEEQRKEIAGKLLLVLGD
jgi:hypothetical protein